MKEKGILLPIFSLPSKYGMGDFGYEAYKFIDLLSKYKIKYWELLPINSFESSPYSPISYYALEEDYISLDMLVDNNLIKRAEAIPQTNRAIYSDFKVKYLKEAFNNFVPDEKYKYFIKDNKEIEYYAKYKNEINKEPIEYYLFLQFVAYSQWMDLKKYANSKGVVLIGDMPMYPTFKSVDTKYHKEYFKMEADTFTHESGAPPDAFNPNGQKWGSPVYNVKNIKKDEYKYLLNRYNYYFKLFDIIRVDHFIGYDHFYEIPMGKSTIEGNYSDGPGYEFFDKLLEFDKSIINRIIVEDLGNLRQETIDLRDKYGFTSQKILQFSIDLNTAVDKDYYLENVVVYPGNHDCQTIKGWFHSLDANRKYNLITFLKNNNCNFEDINKGIIEYCLKSRARLVIVMPQDLIDIDDIARYNIPGKELDSNWTWKLITFNQLEAGIINKFIE